MSEEDVDLGDIGQHPVLAAAGHFGDMRLGRIKPDAPPKLTLTKYLNMDALPPRPTHVPLPAVPDWPMYGNDALGDCTWATVGHLVQGWTEKVGGIISPTDADIEQGYWETGTPPAATGQPGGATDDGRVETDVLGYWRTHGIPNEGHKILAYVSVERHHVREAVYLFGGVYIGVELPLTAQTQQVWDYIPEDPNNQPGSWGGHAVPILAYDKHGFIVITWGAPLRMTDSFRDVYADEVYAIITTDWLDAQGDTLAGFDLAQLQSDLVAVTGSPTTPEATGAPLPTDSFPASAAPDPEPEAADEAETQPEPPSEPTAWDVTVLPDVIHAQTEEEARGEFIQALVEDGSLIHVSEHQDEPPSPTPDA